MIRITVRTDDAAMFANTGQGMVHAKCKSFDISVPELEDFLNDAEANRNYSQRQIIGYEIISPKPTSEDKNG